MTFAAGRLTTAAGGLPLASEAAVFDVSVFCRGLLPAQFLPEAQELLGRFRRIVVPEVAFQEFVNAVHLSERRHGLSPEEARGLIESFESIVTARVWNSRWVTAALETARRYGQPRVYDAIYLRCAANLRLDLWTCDRRFVNSLGHDRPPWLHVCPDDVPRT